MGYLLIQTVFNVTCYYFDHVQYINIKYCAPCLFWKYCILGLNSPTDVLYKYSRNIKNTDLTTNHKTVKFGSS